MSSTKGTKYTRVSASGDIEEEAPLNRQNKRKSLGVPPQYLNLGLSLAMPLCIAVFAGRWLDTRFQTKAAFTIGLLVFGTISVFYNLYKLYGGDEATHKHKR